MSSIAYRLQWKIRALNLLRRTSRPVRTHPGSILSAEEVLRMQEFFDNGASPRQFVRFLNKRNQKVEI